MCTHEAQVCLHIAESLFEEQHPCYWGSSTCLLAGQNAPSVALRRQAGKITTAQGTLHAQHHLHGAGGSSASYCCQSFIM